MPAFESMDTMAETCSEEGRTSPSPPAASGLNAGETSTASLFP